MDVFEYNEVRWPTRALQQEEEEQQISTATLQLQAPSIQWETGSQKVLQPQVLVVAMNPASCELIENCLADSKVVARVVSPCSKQQADTGTTAAARAAAAAATTTEAPAVAAAAAAGSPALLYAVGSDPGQQVVLCCCHGSVGPAAAPAWARGVLQQLQPQRLVLVGTIQNEQYRGDADPSQQLLTFVLQSSAARAAVLGGSGAADLPAYLPTGSVVSGLPAALMTQAELSELPAELLVVVDVLPALVPDTLGELAGQLSKMLSRALPHDAAAAPIGSDWLHRLQHDATVVERARQKLQQTVCRPTSLYS